MISNIELILVTDEEKILYENAGVGLSLALGIIASYLKERSIDVYLKDTNCVADCHQYNENEIDLLSNIYESGIVIDYLKGEENAILDRVAELFLDESDLGKDSYGISIGADFSMMQVHLGFVIAAYLKRRTGKPIFIGGNNISYLYIFKDFYKEILMAAIKGLDFIIKGPGEQVIYGIIDMWNKGERNFTKLPGMMYIQDDEIVCNKEIDPVIIRPSWENLNLDIYSYPLMKNIKENETIYYRFPLSLTNKIVQFNQMNVRERRLFIPYIFNYNCIYKCAFCTQSDSERSGMIVGDIQKVVDDIEYLSKKYCSEYFYFLNNYFPSSMEYIRAFKEELEKRGLKIYWSDCGRVNGMTKEKLQLLYEAGCRKLVFGFESGSEMILNLIDKRLKLEEVVNVLKWCKEVGIWADLEIIIGLPYEREKEFMETYKFMDKYKFLINNFWLNEFFVVPNSLIGRHPERYGICLRKNDLTYTELMQRNKKGFVKRNFMNLTSNARLWGFDETNIGDERTYDQMRIENKDKIERLSTLRNPEFNKLFDFYNKLLGIRKR